LVDAEAEHRRQRRPGRASLPRDQQSHQRAAEHHDEPGTNAPSICSLFAHGTTERTEEHNCADEKQEDPDHEEGTARGEANSAVSGTTRSYAQILRSNVFSFFNTVLFVIGIALLVLGRYSDAFTSVGLGLVNAVISAVQEIRAKRKLDRLQLLDRAAVTVVRDGQEVAVAPEEVVRGDVLRVRAGAQIVVDGPLLDGRVEADESLLSGESDPVVKDPGEELRSGSLCVAGEGHPTGCSSSSPSPTPRAPRGSPPPARWCSRSTPSSR